jgi:hypothetical protein
MTYTLTVELEPMETEERIKLVNAILAFRGVKKIESHSPEIIQKPDTSLMSIIRDAVYLFSDKRDWHTWKKLEQALSEPGVMLSQAPQSIIVCGMGIKAAFYQERYAPSISRALVGIFNHPQARIMFME